MDPPTTAPKTTRLSSRSLLALLGGGCVNFGRGLLPPRGRIPLLLLLLLQKLCFGVVLTLAQNENCVQLTAGRVRGASNRGLKYRFNL